MKQSSLKYINWFHGFLYIDILRYVNLTVWKAEVFLDKQNPPSIWIEGLCQLIKRLMTDDIYRHWSRHTDKDKSFIACILHSMVLGRFGNNHISFFDFHFFSVPWRQIQRSSPSEWECLNTSCPGSKHQREPEVFGVS